MAFQILKGAWRGLAHPYATYTLMRNKPGNVQNLMNNTIKYLEGGTPNLKLKLAATPVVFGAACAALKVISDYTAVGGEHIFGLYFNAGNAAGLGGVQGIFFGLLGETSYFTLKRSHRTGTALALMLKGDHSAIVPALKTAKKETVEALLRKLEVISAVKAKDLRTKLAPKPAQKPETKQTEQIQEKKQVSQEEVRNSSNEATMAIASIESVAADVNKININSKAFDNEDLKARHKDLVTMLVGLKGKKAAIEEAELGLVKEDPNVVSGAINACLKLSEEAQTAINKVREKAKELNELIKYELSPQKKIHIEISEAEKEFDRLSQFYQNAYDKDVIDPDQNKYVKEELKKAKEAIAFAKENSHLSPDGANSSIGSARGALFVLSNYERFPNNIPRFRAPGSTPPPDQAPGTRPPDPFDVLYEEVKSDGAATPPKPDQSRTFIPGQQGTQGGAQDKKEDKTNPIAPTDEAKNKAKTALSMLRKGRKSQGG
jgi:hypothetical protein